MDIGDYYNYGNGVPIVPALIVVGAIIFIVVSLFGNLQPRQTVLDEFVHDSQFISFEWKGHKYLKYSGYDTPAYNTILHDPDCTCRTNKVEVVQ